jgi:hypothetical protein
MATYDVKISLVNGIHAKPPATLPDIDLGDSVRYVSDDGAVKIEFDGPSPYDVSTVADSQAHKVLRKGSFRFRCFIKPRGQDQFVGWDPVKSPESGGDQIIPKHP